MDEFDAAEREIAQESLGAIEVLRRAKNAFLCMAILSVATHVFAFAAARSTVGPPLVRVGEGSRGAVAPISFPRSDPWRRGLESALGWAGFIGRASVLALTGIFAFAILLVLVSRLGGAAAMTRGFVLTLAALAMVVPWVRPGMEEGGMPRAAMFSLDEMAEAMQDGAGNTMLAVVRFVICPLLVAGFLIWGQFCFREAHRRLTLSPAARLPIHEV
jgi:hypothetical protein